MTVYAASYDLENADLCPAGAAKLVEIHRKYEVPATFFCVGQVVEQRADDLKRIFDDDPLFDIQSHTYSHPALRTSPIQGPGVSIEELYIQVGRAADIIADVFGHRPIATRSGGGFYRGMQGEPDRLKVFVECGMKYISTDLRGPFDTIPSPFTMPYTYAADGFPELWELPTHGWHDNVLKWGGHPTMFPPIYPFAGRLDVVKTVQEDFEAAKPWVDYAVEQGLPYVGIVYHPWSVYKFDPDCGTIDLLLGYVKSLGLEVITYTELYRRLAAGEIKVG
ncbi:MAG: polysaccharide deacetylase family protein [Armatimonadetes bacterium]|nr:polysaccharide deacetylase family protein [Armatimonadota bacterium]